MKYAKFLLLPVCVAALAGCVREERTECYTTIIFSYKGDGESEIFAEKIDHVDLYVFDENHRVVLDHHHPSAAELAAGRMRVMLPTGATYHAVAVGNMHTGAVDDLTYGTAFDSKVMHPVTHPDIETGEARIDSHDHLYGGDVRMTIPVEAGSTHTVNFVSGHADMWVEVAGYEEFVAATRQGAASFELEHSGLPPYTDFSGNAKLPEEEWISHYPAARREEGVYIHEYQVMRDLSGSAIHIRDENGVELFTLDVERFMDEVLLPNPGIAGPFNDRGELLQEAFIPIRIEFKAVGVEVSIPDWAVTETTPEF